MDGKKKYSYTSDDIKFPTFIDPEVSKFFKQEMTREVLIDQLNKVMKSLEEIHVCLTVMIRNDKNTFNSLCKNYKRNSYDYVIFCKLVQQLAGVIQSKVTNQQVSKIYVYDDFFSKNTTDNDILRTQHTEIDHDFVVIRKTIGEMIKKIQTIYSSNQEFGIPLICYIARIYLSFTDRVKNQINKFMKIDSINVNEKKKYRESLIIFFDLITTLDRIETGITLFYYGYLQDKNDIFNYDENSEAWRGIKRIVYRVKSNDYQALKAAFESSTENIYKLNKYIESSDSNALFNVTKTATLAMKYTINTDKNLSEFESKEKRFTDEKNYFQSLMGLGKIKAYKMAKEKNYPKIEFRTKIYMKRLHYPITLFHIKGLLKRLYGAEVMEKYFAGIDVKERKKLDDNKLKQVPLWAIRLKQEDKPYFVSTRLFHYYDLKLEEPKNENRPYNLGVVDLDVKKLGKNLGNVGSSILGLFSKKQSVEIVQPKEVIIFIHGGGFLNSNVFYFENFIREMNNELKIPVIAINYSGSPENPYPEALNDCYQAYCWIDENCESQLGFKPEKIILAGDSAGGNLVLALTFLLIAENQYEGKHNRLPNLILPICPCCTTNQNNMNLSLALSLEDFLLDEKTLKFIKDSYKGNYTNEIDPFLNPITANDFLLQNLPPARFFTGAQDPLRDDCFKLLDKISKVNGNSIKAYDFSNYPHGFMGNENTEITSIPHSIFYDEIKRFLSK